MSDQPLGVLLAKCKAWQEDRNRCPAIVQSDIVARTLLPGLAEMVKAAHEMAEPGPYDKVDIDMHLEALAADLLADLLAELEPKEKDDGKMA